MFHPLASYPGPISRAATNIPYLAAMFTGYQHRAIHALHEQYGPVVRIGPNNLSFINPKAWKDIYAHKRTREQDMIKDPEFYVRNPDAPTIVNGNHEEHARYRRLYSPGFSARSLREQEPLIQNYVNMFINGLSRLCENGETPVDMVQWFNFVTFDIIGDLAFGEPFGCLENGATDWLAKLNQIEEAQMQFRIIQHIPFLGRYARQIVNTLFPSDAVKGSEGHRKLTEEKVVRRIKNEVYRPDFMEHILRQPEGKGVTFEEMLSNSATLIQAGSETTATLLSGALFLLVNHPGKMQKLVDELTTAFASDKDMTIENTDRLPYLAAVLEESLRLYSPAVPSFPRQVPKDGATIDGGYVPAGVRDSLRWIATVIKPLIQRNRQVSGSTILPPIIHL
jgi:cytochrome P450